MDRFLHWLSHVIVWRACDCHELPDPARDARYAAWAREWERMDARERREAFARIRR